MAEAGVTAVVQGEAAAMEGVIAGRPDQAVDTAAVPREVVADSQEVVAEAEGEDRENNEVQVKCLNSIFIHIPYGEQTIIIISSATIP